MDASANPLQGAALRELADRGAWDELLAVHAEEAARWRDFLDSRTAGPGELEALRELIALHEVLIGQAMQARAHCMAELAALDHGGHARSAYEAIQSGAARRA